MFHACNILIFSCKIMTLLMQSQVDIDFCSKKGPFSWILSLLLYFLICFLFYLYGTHHALGDENVKKSAAVSKFCTTQQFWAGLEWVMLSCCISCLQLTLIPWVKWRQDKFNLSGFGLCVCTHQRSSVREEASLCNITVQPRVFLLF